jgi:hypothetical protein
MIGVLDERRSFSKYQKKGKMPPIVAKWLEFYFMVIFYVFKSGFL